MATPPVFSAGSVLTAGQMNAVGLWRVTSCTVSSVGGTAATASNGVITIGTGNSSITVNNAFSADAQNYLVQITGGTATSLDWLEFQFVGSTGTTYAWATLGNTWGTAGNNLSSNTVSKIRIGTHDSSNYSVTTNILNPFAALQKAVYGQSASNQYFSTTNGRDTSAVSRTGFTLTSAGVGVTFTGGTIRVYGYNN